MQKKPTHVVVEGQAMSKSDKELAEAILGGEMKNAWQPGDGVDQRSKDGSKYSRRGPWSGPGSEVYRKNHERTFDRR